MANITNLKQVIINKFSNVLRRSQRGYPLEDYSNIREAMLAINMIDNFTVEPNFQQAIVDYYTYNLNLI